MRFRGLGFRVFSAKCGVSEIWGIIRIMLDWGMFLGGPFDMLTNICILRE